MRYLLNDNKKEISNDPNLSLYVCLERKYLWNNKIFSQVGDNFNELIKKYLDNSKFKIDVKHALEFYNVIGEEERKFMSEEKDRFSGKDTRVANNLVNSGQNKLNNGILNLTGNKNQKIGGPKMKPKQK